MAWVYLFFAGLFEIAFVVSTKYNYGYTKLWPSVATIVLSACGMFLFSLAVRTLPLTTSYLIWIGIGTLGIGLLSIVLFSEQITILKAVFIICILIGVVGLKLSTSA